MTTTTNITDEQITTLSSEAAGAGDLDMVAICDRALGGDRAAREACAEAIASAAAMVDED